MIKTRFLNPQNLPLVIETAGDKENERNLNALLKTALARRDRWQAGDVLTPDNIPAAHGRMPFTGARKIAFLPVF